MVLEMMMVNPTLKKDPKIVINILLPVYYVFRRNSLFLEKCHFLVFSHI